MANRERGELTLVAGGTRYTLRLTTNSCAELEDFTSGRTSDEVIAGVNKGSYRDVRLLLWMALRDRHGNLATDDQDCLKDIGDLIDAAGGRAVVVTVMRDLVQLNSDDRPGGAARPREAQPARPTGVSSVLMH